MHATIQKHHARIVVILLCGLTLSPPLTASADTFEWAFPSTNAYNNPLAWNDVTPPSTLGTPGVGDVAVFNIGGLYTVGFNQDEFSDEVFVQAGIVSFLSNNSTVRTYTISTDGGSTDVDVDVSGGDLQVGAAGTPVQLVGSDAILFVGVGAGEDDTLSVVGSGSSLKLQGTSRTHPIGALGGDGTLNLTDSAVADFGLGTLDVGVSNSGATDGVVNVESAADLSTGQLAIGSRISAATGVVTVTGSGSTITAGDIVTIGSESGGGGTLNIESSGLFQADGVTTIRSTGVVTVIGGTFDANDDVLLEGGALTKDASGSFGLASGKSLIASDGAVVDFSGPYLLNNNTTFEFNSGAEFDTSGTLQVGAGTDGALTVDGGTTEFDASGSTTLGSGGGQAAVVIRNGATVNLAIGDTLDLGVSNVAGTSGFINLESGAQLTAGETNVGTGAAGLGTLTLTGAATTFEQTAGAALTIGGASGGQGVVNALDGALRTGSGLLTINATGEVNIAGGAVELGGDVLVYGGEINHTAGQFILPAGATLTATKSGLVDFSGNYQIVDDTTFEIMGGAVLRAGDLDIANNTGGGDGTLIVDKATVVADGGNAAWGFGGQTATVTFRDQASGAFANMRLADSTNNASAANWLIESGATVTTGDIEIATAGSGATGTITIDGGGSSLTQNGASTLTVGSTGGIGSATIDLTGDPLSATRGTLTTGAGLTTINATGAVHIDGGEFNAMGDILIDGGTFTFVQGGLGFGIETTLTSLNGAEVDLGGLLDVRSGNTFEITSGSVLRGRDMTVGFATSDGTLIVDNATLEADSFESEVGSDNSTGVVTLRNNAVATLASLRVAGGLSGDGSGTVSVESGASLTTDDIRLATSNNAAVGVLSVDGAGSMLTQTGASTLTVGSTGGTGSATINLTTGGQLITGTGGTTINATGTVLIDGGGFSTQVDTLVDGGSFRFLQGFLDLGAGTSLDVRNGGEVFMTFLQVRLDRTIQATSGSMLLARSIEIGYSGSDGALVVDNSTLSASSTLSQVGTDNATGFLTLRNSASASLADLDVGHNDGSGTVSVESGSLLNVGDIRVGAGDNGGVGTISVDGAGSIINQSTGSVLTLGAETASGVTTIDLANGGKLVTGTGLTTINATGRIDIQDTPSEGVLEVNGDIDINGGRITGVQHRNIDNHFSWAEGKTMTIQNGGQLNLNGLFQTPNNATILVTGDDSQVFGFTRIAELMGGTLVVVEDDALWLAATMVKEDSTMAVVDGGRLLGDFEITTGDFFVDNGRVAGSSQGVVGAGNAGGTADLHILNGGTVELVAVGTTPSLIITEFSSSASAAVTIQNGPSRLLTEGISIGNSSGATGTLRILSGEVVDTGQIDINATGEIIFNSGRLSAQGITNSAGGSFDFNGGRLSVVTFDGDLVNEGGTLAPGTSAGSTTIIGDYTQQTGATLEIEIGGALQGTEFDFVNVTDLADINGDLQLQLIDDFVPAPSDTFTILVADTLVGAFDNIASGARLETISGGSFLVTLDFALDQIVLSDFQLADALAGDYNADGLVDAIDYAVWRESLGMTGAGLAADGDGDGMVDSADFDIWRENYGAVFSASAIIPIPEPSTMLLAMFAATVSMARCRE